jgi:hypothetical protein
VRPDEWQPFSLRPSSHLLVFLAEDCYTRQPIPSFLNLTMSSSRDLEQAVAKDASDFIRELEVERILRAFKLKYVRPDPSLHFINSKTTLLTPSSISLARMIFSICQLEPPKMKSRNNTEENRS